MLTIFTIPKPFTNQHINIIQRNAIKSWTLLHPACEIILVGNDNGVAKTAQEYNIKHIPKVKCNEFNTPLLNSALDLVRQKSKNDILVYVNADIILLSSFMNIIKYLPEKEFLVVGQRWDIDIKKLINFNNPDWEKSLRKKIENKGILHPPSGSDYFVFKKESFKNLPSFAVGRIDWDNWMIYEARRQKMTTIDATKMHTVIHQNHDYSHLNGGKKGIFTNPEARRNLKLAKSKKHIFTLKHTNYKLTKSGLKKKKVGWNLFIEYIKNTPEILSGNILFWRLLYLLLFVPYKLVKSINERIVKRII